MARVEIKEAYTFLNTCRGYWGGYINGAIGNSWRYREICSAYKHSPIEADEWWLGYLDGLGDYERIEQLITAGRERKNGA